MSRRSWNRSSRCCCPIPCCRDWAVSGSGWCDARPWAGSSPRCFARSTTSTRGKCANERAIAGGRLSDRFRDAALRRRIATASEAAACIAPGETVAVSGFTGAGYPKSVPQALAARMQQSHAQGDPFRVRLLTGASTAPELDGALAKVEGMEMRLPYQSDPTVRRCINEGRIDYVDIHLSHVAQYTWFGFFGDVDVAIIEVAAILEDGRLVPTSSVGNNKTWLEQARKVILEVNRWQPLALEGMHDIYFGTALPPNRKPIPLVHADDRIGQPWLRVDPEKVVAVVETEAHDRNSPFDPPDDASRRI